MNTYILHLYHLLFAYAHGGHRQARDKATKILKSATDSMKVALAGMAFRELILTLLKFVNTAISAKMLLIAFATLLVNKGKLLVELKKLKQQEEPKVVYYNTHHDHHQDLWNGDQPSSKTWW